MNILVFGIHYHPDLIGISKYSGEMCEWLASKGHKVEVITGKPFYPDWEVQSSYKKKLWFTERLNGVTVFRCPLYVPKSLNASRKIIHEGLFVLSSLVYWFKKLFSKPDIIITVCPPFHGGLLSVMYAKFFNIPHIYHIQDLQVDIARDLKMIKNKSLLNILFSLERFIMNHSTKISTISDGMENEILEKGVDKSKIWRLPNWVDSNLIYPIPKEKSLKKELGFNKRDKIVLYAGNLGQKQGLEIVIEAAKELKNESAIKFVIVGQGAGKKRLVDLVNSYQLNNVFFFPLQPYEKLSALLAIGDLHLVLQLKNASDLVLPSKLTSILAAGGCPLITAESHSTLFQIIEENQLGIIVEPESKKTLVEGIMLGLNSDTSTYKKNARSYAQQYLDKENILKSFENDLEKHISLNILSQ